MYSKLLFSVFCCLYVCSIANAQDDELIIDKDSTLIAKEVIYTQGIDPLSPSRAAFYSAVLVGFYIFNDKEFKRYRTAFKQRRAGVQDEFTVEGVELINEDGLVRAQEVLKKNRDLSLFITIGLYALNILEANVDAHLPDKALDKNLSLKPAVFTDPYTNKPLVGLSMNFNF